MTTRALTIASIKMFVRNRQALFFTLIMPFIFIGIFGLIGFDRVPKIEIGIVQEASEKRVFSDALAKVPAFEINYGTEADERAMLAKGDRAVVLFVPAAVDAGTLQPGTTATITVLKNTAQEQQAQTAISIISQFLDQTTLQAVQAPKLFTLDIQDISAKKQKYIDFLLPGIVAMSIMQMSVFSVAFLFTDFKEKGILKRLIATPMKPYQFVVANVITRLLVALFQTAALLGAGSWIFGSHVYGAWWLIFLISFLGGIMFLALGFTISGLSKTVDAVPAIANLILFPMLFLSGIFFPTSTMPSWLQNVVEYLPLAPFAHAMREVVANGASIVDIQSDFLWILGWAVVLVTTAIFTFGFEEKRI